MKKFFKWYNILFVGLLIFILVEPALAVEIETKVELVAKEGCEIVEGGELKELLQTILDYIRMIARLYKRLATTDHHKLLYVTSRGLSFFLLIK